MPIIDNEVSQKEKHQYSILMHIMEFRKMVMMTLYARQQKRHRYKEQTFGLWEKVRVRWFAIIALKHVYYHIRNRWPVQVQCMKQSTQSQCSGTTQKLGWDGGGCGVQDWGTHVHPWLIHVNVWQKPSQYCKVIILQLKLIN